MSIAQPRVVVGLDPHANRRTTGAEGVTVELGDADPPDCSGASPQSPPARPRTCTSGPRSPATRLHHPGRWGVQPSGGLGRPDGETRTVAVGPTVGADRAGGAGLDVGHPQLIVFGQPWRLVGVDAQRQDARIQPVVGGGAFWGAPLRQVVSHPPVGRQVRTGEVLLEDDLVAGSVEGVGVIGRTRVSLGRAYAAPLWSTWSWVRQRGHPPGSGSATPSHVRIGNQCISLSPGKRGTPATARAGRRPRGSGTTCTL